MLQLQSNVKTMMPSSEFKELTQYLVSDEFKECKDSLPRGLDHLIGLGAAMHITLVGLDASMKALDGRNPELLDMAWRSTDSASHILNNVCGRSDGFSIAMTQHMAETKLCLLSERKKAKKIPEKEYSEELIANFKSYFPNLSYVDCEVRVSPDDHDRIDILAKLKDGQPVIMELKLGNKSAHKQLRSYAVGFDSPILMNISEELPKNKRKDIFYTTFDELGVFKQ